MADQLQQGASQEEVQSVRLPRVLHQQIILAKPEAGVIYKFKGGLRGWWGNGFGSPRRGTKRHTTPGDLPPPPDSDQLLDWERIMCNKRAATLEMRLHIETGDVKPVHLGVTLTDFTEWALPYIPIKDEDTKWAGWHDIEGLERVCHTGNLQDGEKRPMHFRINKPLKNAQTYPSPPPPPVGCLQVPGRCRLPAG